MKKSFLIKLGSPALLLGFTAVGCTQSHPAALSAIAPNGNKAAARLAGDAEAAIKARDGAKAVALAERAVALTPRDAGYRATLGQAYLAAGRFGSAEASFTEALALVPGQPRARFNLALAQIALGKRDVARATLAALDGAVPETDRGLAVALAGDRDGGIAILERAARAKDATAKTRQNLALSYALAGRWQEAHGIAEQDVPADQLPLRLSQWAKFAEPQSSWDQIASLLGVIPAADPGRPPALALADPAPTATAFADAAPVPPAAINPPTADVPAAVPTPSVGPVDIAAAAPPAAVPEGSFVAPVRAPAPSLLAARAAPVHVAVFPRAAIRAHADGKWVVQIGAFSQPGAAQAAWMRLSRRNGVRAYAPTASTFVFNKSATLTRLTLSGFAGRGDAQRVCGGIKARGGSCFVRAAAGEQPIQWALNDAGSGGAKIAVR